MGGFQTLADSPRTTNSPFVPWGIRKVVCLMRDGVCVKTIAGRRGGLCQLFPSVWSATRRPPKPGDAEDLKTAYG